jgi:SEFIR domain-containing protein
VPEPVRVFISYSHDSPEHMDRVLDLSNRLREGGVDCRIDQYEESPREGWPQWCERHVERSNFVLVACTETYLRRFKGEEVTGKGLGGTWEGHIITQELYNAQGKNRKFIPIIFSEQDAFHIPLTLQGGTHYEAPKNYDSLYRRLTGQSLIQMPALGSVKPMPVRQEPRPLRVKSDVGQVRPMPALERKGSAAETAATADYSARSSPMPDQRTGPGEVPAMRPDPIRRQRIRQLEELLEIEYEKLSEFQKEIAVNASPIAKFELRQRLKREVLPDIRRHEVEYAELLAEEANPALIPAQEAESAVAEVVDAVDRIEGLLSANHPEELTRMLADVRKKLDDPGKAAAAKLKVTLPIIPMIASYEMEMDTEAVLSRAWRRLRRLFGSKV